MTYEFEDVNGTLKVYPINEIQKKTNTWSESQQEKRMSVMINKDAGKKVLRNVCHKLLTMGFAFTGNNTFIKDLNLDNMAEEQLALMNLFPIDIEYN